MGTLGGGNHFIELVEDGDGDVWLTLHSGSRGVGNKIGSHYIKVVQQLCASMGVRLPIVTLPIYRRTIPRLAAILSRALFKYSLVHAGSTDSFSNRLVQFLDFFPCREDIEVFAEFGAFDNAAAQVV